MVIKPLLRTLLKCILTHTGIFLFFYVIYRLSYLFSYNVAGEWNDFNPTSKQAFICSHPVSASETFTGTVDCPDGWVRFNFIEYHICYIHVTNTKIDKRHKIDIFVINFLLTRKILLTHKPIVRISQKRME